MLVGARLLLFLSGRVEQLPGASDIVGADAAGEQAVMADAVEAARQHVREKAADELLRVERHGLVSVTCVDPIILPFERDGMIVERDQPAVGDGDAVRVASQIGQRGFGTISRTLGGAASML